MFGDGVNVAARLEALAEPGGIRLSAAAHEQVRDRLALKTACVARRTRQPDRAPSARGALICDGHASMFFACPE